eukprot:scaffold40681_cov30-Tisochrysis_lutea.AAC.3
MPILIVRRVVCGARMLQPVFSSQSARHSSSSMSEQVMVSYLTLVSPRASLTAFSNMGATE